MGKGILLAALAAATSIFATTAAQSAQVEPPSAKPAGGATFVAATDLEWLKSIRETLAKKNFSSARSMIASISDPTARSLGEWYYFEAEDPLVSLSDADAFLDRHPEWPSGSKIRTHVEKRISWSATPGSIRNFFASRDPLTGEGKIQLARAQFATGEADAAILHVKDAWINNNFTLADEQRVLSYYGGRLSLDDHAARVDRLLWAREVSTAKRSIAHLRAEDRRRANARAALLLGGADAPKAYDGLSAEDRRDAGVMLAAIRYFRRAEEEPRAIAIARDATSDPVAARAPSRWWDEQQLLMRWALKNRLYADAYAMASHHALEPGSADFAEAEFNAGWVALRYLNDAARAEKHFAALTAGVAAPISVSRGWFWLARAAEARGHADIAKRRYEKAAEQIYTFYGQLAAEKIGGGALNRTFEQGPPATPEEKARFGSRPAVNALRLLAELKDDRAFLVFAYHIDDLLQSRGEFRELADLATRMNAPHVVVRAGKVAVRSGAFAPDIAYPSIYVPKEAARFAPPEVILGLSRQESEFNPRAYSRAGARGMMQLIPSTAQATARKEGLPYKRDALLADQNYNMLIGSAHLSHLIDRFGGSWIMTFAGYNAGVNRVDQWVEAYGDPRSPALDPLDWMEQIPFEETRNYVQRVLENSQIYRSRLTSAPIAGQLSRDIERGGARNRVSAIAAKSAPGVIPDVQARIAAVAEPILNPLAAPMTAPSHLRVKPQAPETAAEAEAMASTPQNTRAKGGRRPNIKLRRDPPPPPGAHDAPTPVAETAPSPVATPASTSSAISASENAVAPVAAAPLVMAPVDSASALEKIDAETVYAAEALVAPETEESPATAGGVIEAADAKECVTYSDFIAETAKEEASADDLNAGGLAELQSDAPACQ